MRDRGGDGRDLPNTPHGAMPRGTFRIPPRNADAVPRRRQALHNVAPDKAGAAKNCHKHCIHPCLVTPHMGVQAQAERMPTARPISIFNRMEAKTAEKPSIRAFTCATGNSRCAPS